MMKLKKIQLNKRHKKTFKSTDQICDQGHETLITSSNTNQNKL
jgi:hypothetical protein